MTEIVGPTGFWSYVHKDDEGANGQILRLSKRIAAEFAMITAQDLEIFVDRSSLEWGQEWDLRINIALQETTFFIPIVTPRYFLSQACRNELLKFSGYARSLGAEELLLPIYYVNVDDLDPDSEDETKALIARTQYVDWRKLRLVDEQSAEYAQAINDMAVRLAAISKDYAARPTLTPEEVSADHPDAELDGDDEPGLIDLIAQLEDAMPRWLETLEALPGVMQEITDITTRATAKINKGDEQGKGFAHRIIVAREMAAEMDEPAERIKGLGEQYALQLLSMDPGARALISLAGEPDRTEEERQTAREMFESLKTLITSSRENRDALGRFSASLQAPARQLRDLRPTLRKIDSGLRSVLDAQAILEEWDRFVDNSPLMTKADDDVSPV